MRTGGLARLAERATGVKLRGSLVLLDPGNFTPEYVQHVMFGLRDLGWAPELSTSRHAFDAIHQPKRQHFFEALAGRQAMLPTRIRQLLKVALYPHGLWRLDQRLQQLTPGLIHVQWSLLPWLDAWFWRRWKKRGWTIVYTAHDVLPLPGTLPSCYAPGLRFLLPEAAAVVVHSRFGRRVLQLMGAKPASIRTLPMGACLPPNVERLDRTTARRDLGLPQERPTLLFLGYVKAYKGLSVLLQALQLVAREFPDVLLVIAGHCPSGELARVQKQVSALGLGGQVELRAGYVPAGLVSAYLSATDLVVLPYLAASSSAVLVASAHSSRVVVASRVGGLSEAIDAGTTGLLVPKNQPAALAAALANLLRDPERRLRMESAAGERAITHFRWDTLCGGLDKLYLELLGT